MLDWTRHAASAVLLVAALLGASPHSSQRPAFANQGSVHTSAVDPELQVAIESYLAGQPGSYGVAVRDLGTGQTALVNADQPFLAASTYKVLVMYRVYQGLAAGSLSLDTPVTITYRDAETNGDDGTVHPGQTVTVADLLEAMITLSDNTAAFALTRVTGGWGGLDAAADELGMTQTTLESSYYWTTADDLLTFFQALAAGQLVSPEASADMVALLSRNTANDRIPAGLPAGVTVAHKTGELGTVRNDAGIVYGAGSPIVVVVLGSDAAPDSLSETIAGVARLAYQHLAE